MSKKVNAATQSAQAQAEVSTAVAFSAPETLNQHAVDSMVCVLIKGDKAVIASFKDALEVKKTTAMAVIKTNWDNQNLDRDGLPKGSAPNDLYNTISEVERALQQTHSDKDRIGVAASTVRSLVAKVCSEISRYKTELAGKTGKATSTNSKADESYM